jgi:tRNA dimethylallyltransferase
MNTPLPIIIGPTAVGKTKIAVEVASEIDAEIVSCDSRQIYRHMDVGTSKPTEEELAAVPHWLIDVVTPDSTLNAWEYAKLARKRIGEIWQRDRVALVVGGSGLYLRALIDGFFKIPSYDRAVREKLESKTSGLLYDRLSKVDPITANTLHPNDRMRIVRALEVYELTGTPISVLKTNRVPFDCSPVYIGFTMDRAALYDRIERRVDFMIDNGFVEEVKRILAEYPTELNSLQSIGYKELIAHVQGEMSLDKAVEFIKRNTRRYAKRQLTWFNGIRNVHWIELPDPEAVKKCVSLIRGFI